MNVPNHEKKPFRDMTPEERSAIVEAKLQDNADFLLGSTWEKSDLIRIDFDRVYRTRPRQLVIPWEHIKPEYKWAAMDDDGSVYVYKTEPEIRLGSWSGGFAASASALNINTTGIDWRESLTARPEGV